MSKCKHVKSFYPSGDCVSCGESVYSIVEDMSTKLTKINVLTRAILNERVCAYDYDEHFPESKHDEECFKCVPLKRLDEILNG